MPTGTAGSGLFEAEPETKPIKTTSYDVARMFLRELGAPVTDALTRAVAIWLIFESGGVIRGNNPWNLHSGAACTPQKGYCSGQGSLPGQIGNRYAGPGDKNVAVFATLQDGVKASVNNLTKRPAGDWTGYDKIVSEARRGSAIGFLKAVQNSRWSAGHYGYSKLTTAFASSATYIRVINFASYGGESAKGPIEGTQRNYQESLLDTLGTAVGNLTDPGFYARVLALIAGVGLVGFGIIRLVKA